MTFAISSLNNARLVKRLGLTVLVRRMSVVGAAMAVVFVVVAVASDGKPNFIVFSVLVGLVVAAVQGLITNCNTAALSPLAHVAGTAAAIVSTVSTAGGSLLASLANGSFNGSTMPFTVFVAAYVGLAALFVLFGSAPSRQR